jgi:hypothetical protein
MIAVRNRSTKWSKPNFGLKVPFFGRIEDLDFEGIFILEKIGTEEFYIFISTNGYSGTFPIDTIIVDTRPVDLEIIVTDRA